MRENWKFNFVLIWSGQAFSILTSAVLQMALIWHLTAITQSAMVLSLASIAGFLPTALLSAFAGTLVDRWKRKIVIVGADMFIALVSLILAIYALFAELPVWLILVVLFVRSIGTAFHTPAISAITPLIVPENMLTKCSGVIESFQTFGYIIGAAIAGVLYSVWSLSGMVFLDVLGALIASFAVIYAKIPELNTKHEDEEKHFFKELKDGYKVIYHHKGLFSLLWIGALFMIIYSPINALFPLMSLDYFNGTTIQASIAEVTFSLGMFIGGVTLGTTGGFKDRAKSIFGSLLLMGAAILVSGLLPISGFIVFAGLSFFMGFAAPYYTGPFMALVQERIEPEYLGRVFGLYTSLMSLTMPIGLIISGIFADSVGVHIWFFLSGVVTLILAVITYLIPSIRYIENEKT
ncbi:MAG: MFS transporter [Coprobacillus sp.]